MAAAHIDPFVWEPSVWEPSVWEADVSVQRQDAKRVLIATWADERQKRRGKGMRRAPPACAMRAHVQSPVLRAWAHMPRGAFAEVLEQTGSGGHDGAELAQRAIKGLAPVNLQRGQTQVEVTRSRRAHRLSLVLTAAQFPALVTAIAFSFAEPGAKVFAVTMGGIMIMLGMGFAVALHTRANFHDRCVLTCMVLLPVLIGFYYVSLSEIDMTKPLTCGGVFVVLHLIEFRVSSAASGLRRHVALLAVDDIAIRTVRHAPEALDSVVGMWDSARTRICAGAGGAIESVDDISARFQENVCRELAILRMQRDV